MKIEIYDGKWKFLHYPDKQVNKAFIFIILTIGASSVVLNLSQVTADPGNRVRTLGNADGMLNCEGRDIESDFDFDAIEDQTGKFEGDISLRLDMPEQREEFETQNITV